MNSSVVDDVVEAAEWVATALTSSCYAADFSARSLWEVDRFFEERSSQGRAWRGGLLAESLGARLFALGAYPGEAIRRDVGGDGPPMTTTQRPRSASSFTFLTAASSGRSNAR